MALSPGTRRGHYDVTAIIGEGRMGEVRQARDTKLDRDVALKVLPEAFTSDPRIGVKSAKGPGRVPGFVWMEFPPDLQGAQHRGDGPSRATASGTDTMRRGCWPCNVRVAPVPEPARQTAHDRRVRRGLPT